MEGVLKAGGSPPQGRMGSVRQGPPPLNTHGSDVRCPMATLPAVVIDTNVFVAALFRTDSHAARLVAHVRQGAYRMVWNEETKRETHAIVAKIPPIEWASVECLFDEGCQFAGLTSPGSFLAVPDPDDRKFAALAHASGAILISQDSDLLDHPERLPILVLTPKEFLDGIWM